MDAAQPNVKVSDISDEVLLDICQAAEILACECPGYIARILRQVRTFQRYTHICIEQFPEDAETHVWLIAQAERVNLLLVETIIELMQREQLVDESGQILLDRMSMRAREIAHKQLGIS